MTFHLGGGPGGIKYFIEHVGTAWEDLWQDMAKWTSVPAQAVETLQAELEKGMGDKTLEEMDRWRDENIVKLCKIIYKSQTPQ